jgi:hypothetical protein
VAVLSAGNVHAVALLVCLVRLVRGLVVVIRCKHAVRLAGVLVLHLHGEIVLAVDFDGLD